VRVRREEEWGAAVCSADDPKITANDRRVVDQGLRRL